MSEKHPATLAEPGEPLVSIVVPTKNRPDSLNRLLLSISRQSYPKLEIIIVDDGSERPVELANQNVNGITLIRNDESQGCCSARNQGIEKASGEYIVVLDDDAELENDSTITRAIDLIVKYPDCGAIGFRQLQSDGQLHYMQPTTVNHICYTALFFGYGFLLRRQMTKRVGNFNPHLGFYYDENEYCLRLINVGYKTICDPDLRVIHHHDSRGRNNSKMHRLVLRNSILTALLHAPVWCIPPQIAIRLIHFIRLSRAEQGIDWRGIGWVCRELKASASYVQKNRQPMRFKTLLAFHRLNRSPIIIQ